MCSARATAFFASALLPACSLATDLDPLGGGGATTGTNAAASGAATATSGSTSATGGGSSGEGGSSGGSAGAAGEVARFGEHDLADYNGVTRDTFVSQAEPAANYGGDDFLHVDADPANVALLRFDVSALGASVTVTGVELHVGTAGDSTAGEVELFEVLESWDAGEGNGDSGVCNWTHREAGVPWTTAGVGLGSRGMETLGAFAPTAVYTDYAVPLPPELVQGWLADPDTNFGVAMVTVSPDSVDLRASGHAQSDHRPMLVVTYTP